MQFNSIRVIYVYCKWEYDFTILKLFSHISIFYSNFAEKIYFKMYPFYF